MYFFRNFRKRKTNDKVGGESRKRHPPSSTFEQASTKTNQEKSTGSEDTNLVATTANDSVGCHIDQAQKHGNISKESSASSMRNVGGGDGLNRKETADKSLLSAIKRSQDSPMPSSAAGSSIQFITVPP